MLPHVERFFDAFRASLLEPKRGMKVRLLTYSHSATKDVTHEVREVPPPTSLQGRAMYFGTRKNCIRFIEHHGLDWADAPAGPLFSERSVG